MNRFFYHSSQKSENHVILSGEEAHHLRHVLRSAPGDKLELCDESGSCHIAGIMQIEKDSILCRLSDQLMDTEAKTRIYLAFGLLKGEKNELVLQKATELGAAGFFPFISERAVVKTGKNFDNRLTRWEKIIQSAAAQSKRALVPTVAAPCRWQDILKLIPDYEESVIFWEKETKKTLPNISKAKSGSILLITGPEGGFSRAEAEAAVLQRARIATLGPRILRAETAAISAVAVTLYQAGEMGGWQ